MSKSHIESFPPKRFESHHKSLTTTAVSAACTHIAVVVSMIVISALAIQGVLSGQTASWTLVGLQIGVLGLSSVLAATCSGLSGGQREKSKQISGFAFDIVTSLALIGVGIAGGFSLLSGYAIGVIFCSVTASIFTLGCIKGSYCDA